MKSGLIVYNSIDRQRNIWFINRLLDEFNSETFSLRYLDEDELLDYVEEHNVDFVIYRGRNYHLLEALAKKNIRTYNNPLTNQIANDKLMTADFLKENSINGVPTLEKSDSLSFPYIKKSRDGHGGTEVFLIANQDEEKPLKNAIYQPYLENDGDMRIFILNHQVIAAVKRHNNHDFRSNFSLGGDVVLYKPDQNVIDTAIKISRLLGATYIGIDFLLTKKGSLVNEIEDPVGSRMLYQVSDIDIVQLLIDYIKKDLA